MSLIIGLTGGIGSGKTAVSDCLADYGITIVDADICSRVIVEPGKPALAEIVAHFGDDALLADGQMNRAWLRQQVFANPEQRKVLEKITHPRIAEEIGRQLAASDSAYTVLVSPLLFESGQSAFVQRTLVVDAPQALQIERTTRRDGVAEDNVKAIIKAQLSREARLAKADDVLVNDGDLTALQDKARQFHLRYLQMAKDAL